jgi:hypothetical protein
MIHPLGPIHRLQVQPTLVKIGEEKRYDPAGLLAVGRLRLTSDGAIGLDADGRPVHDVHHADHPASRYRGNNALSLSFTSHYAAMRDRFGDHLTDGCAAENILIAADGFIPLPQLRRYVLIRSAAGGAWVVLERPEVDAPCLPFARYATRDAADPAAIKAALQALDHGGRGYYLTPLVGAAPVEIAVGDSVYAADALPDDVAPGAG